MIATIVCDGKSNYSNRETTALNFRSTICKASRSTPTLTIML